MKSAEKDLIPTPGEIWKILKETNRLLQKSREETDLLKQENDRRKLETDRKIQENDRLLQKSREETDRKIQENDRLLRESKLENDRRKLETDRKIQENDRLLQKSREETNRKIQENDRLLRETQEKNDRLLQKTQKKLEKMIEENKLSAEKRAEENKLHLKQIDSRWGNEWGKLVEALIEGNFIDLLNKKGIKVTKANPNHKGRRHDEEKEFDIVATNGNEIVVVETKSTLTTRKVNKFLKVMGLFKEYCPEFGALTVYGGMACLKGSPEVLSYAESHGLLVLKVSGHNAVLTNKPKFKAKVFC